MPVNIPYNYTNSRHILKEACDHPILSLGIILHIYLRTVADKSSKLRIYEKQR